MIFSKQRCLARVLLGLALTFLPNQLAFAQQPSGAAIAKATNSIVAIGRVRKDKASPLLLSAERFPSQDYRLGAAPADPEFFPHELGAGVVIDRSGLILTSLHFLGEISQSQYFVWVQRRAFPAKVKAADPWLDVAVLEVAADDLIPLELGDARRIKVEDSVIALCDPLGVARDGEPEVSIGQITALGCEAPALELPVARNGLQQILPRRDTLHHYGTLLQFQPESPTLCSGGALINLDGQLIGLVTTYVATPNQEASGGLAIPIDEDFQKALETLKRGVLPEYGLLGVVLPPPDRKDRPGKIGATVEDVMPGSPAAKAKLRPGDVVTHVGDQQVQDHQQLIRLVSALPAETQVTLQVVRDPESKTKSKKSFPVVVTLSKKYQESAREPFAEVREPAWRGMRVDYATASPVYRELARHVDPEGCVAVIDVERDSPAWKAGLRSGTFVSHVGKRRVSTPRQFREAVEQQVGETALRITSAGDGDPVRKIAAS